MRYLYENRNSPENCLKIVGSDGSVEWVHEEVLKRSSAVFEKALVNDFAERSENQISLPYGNNILRQIVHYIYFGYLEKETRLDLPDYMNLTMFFYEHEFREMFDELKEFVAVTVPRGPLDNLEEWIGVINWLNSKNDLFPQNFYSGLLRMFHIHMYIDGEKNTRSKLNGGVLADVECRKIKQACRHSEHTTNFYCGLKL